MSLDGKGDGKEMDGRSRRKIKHNQDIFCHTFPKLVLVT